MKHGPIALIEPHKKTKIILIILDNDHLNEMILTLSEVNSREAFTIVITDCLYKLDQSKIDLSI
jgi:glucosamine 6-phosphate synthetase-like amidotransferase/phosphosugar isomerase protein